MSDFTHQHAEITRRFFIKAGAVGASVGLLPTSCRAVERGPALQKAIDELEAWLTKPDEFRDVSRGKPKPHSLPEDKKKEVGLTRETWQLEVLSDPDHKAQLRSPLAKESNTALNFNGLMQLAKTRAVRFPKIMTCLNLGCPLGNGIWEGVPLRDVLWMAQPVGNLRRVFYHGYHNNDPEQMFRSSLPVGRVLEDPFDLPPVILCYKLNGQWLTPERGGPVRVVVPEAYGFKNIKWLTQVFLSNLSHANDTYAEKNNDVDSPLKTFCETLYVPDKVKPGEPIPLTGYAQVGISGLSKVQVWMENSAQPYDKSNDRYFNNAPWRDAEILSAPTTWGGDLPNNTIPHPTHSFDANGRPKTWPLRFSKAHWAVLHPGLPSGSYTLRCRTVDANGVGQPLPRPFKKSGRAAIQMTPIEIS